MPSKYEIENALLKKLYSSDDTVAPINEESSSPLSDLFKSLAWKKRRISPSDNSLLQESVGKPVYEDFEIPTNWTDEKLNEAIAQLRVQQKIDGTAARRNITGGLTWDATDEIEAGIRGALDPTKTYGDYRQQIDRERQEYRHRKPDEALAQEVFPSLVSGFGLVKALPKVGKAVMGSKILNSPWFRAPVGGALSAGLYGAGAKPYESKEGRLERGMSLSPFGAAAGMLGPLAGTVGPRLVPPLKKLVDKYRKEEVLREQADVLEFDTQKMIDEEALIDAATKNAQSAGKEGFQPSTAAMSDRLTDTSIEFMEEIDPRIAQQAAAAEKLPITQNVGPQARIEKAKLEWNTQKVQDEYNNALNVDKVLNRDASDNAKEIFEVIEGNTRLGRNMRDGLADELKGLEESVQTKAIEKEIVQLRNTIKKLGDGNIKELTIRDLNTIKKAAGNRLNFQAEKAGVLNITKREPQDINNLRMDRDAFKKWLHQVDDEFPDYAKARQSMSNEFDYEDAYNAGTDFFKPYKTNPLKRGKKTNDVYDNLDDQQDFFDSLTEQEKLRFQAGALTELDGLINRALSSNTNVNSATALLKAISKDAPDLAKKLKIIMGKEDAQLFTAALDLDAKMINNYKKLLKAEQKLLGAQPKKAARETSGIPAVKGELFSYAVNLLTEAFRSNRLNPNVKKKLYKSLTSNDPAERAAATAALEKANKQKGMSRSGAPLGQLGDTSAIVLGKSGVWGAGDLDVFDVLFHNNPHQTSLNAEPKDWYKKEYKRSRSIPWYNNIK